MFHRPTKSSKWNMPQCAASVAAVWTISACLALLPTSVTAGTEFETWIESLWSEAKTAGVTRKTFNDVFSNIEPDPDVINLLENQPEHTKPVWEYLEQRVNEDRLAQGREILKKQAEVLNNLETAYGVDRHILVAIWGLESTYGTDLGTRNVVRSLATLAFKGTRSGFWKSQLIAALKIIQNGDISKEDMVGSWAGAMGHTQFIPTTYIEHAIDFDGDGRRDVWGSIPDALASAANYLKESKWQRGQNWGYEVALPPGFEYGSSGFQKMKKISEWQKLGVRRIGNLPFPNVSEKAALILPAGANGPAFLVQNNFRSILRYNAAISYAIAVGHLADRLRGLPEFQQAWPKDERPLGRAEREELQRLLTEKGYKVGGIDGIVGAQTKSAVRAYQKSKGLKQDGYPSNKLLSKLRQDS